MILIVPEPVTIHGTPFGIKELISWWVDNAEQFQKPISRVRLGIKVLTAIEAEPVPGTELDLPKDAIEIFRELASAAALPVWTNTVTGQPIPIPARAYLTLLEVFLPTDS